jgi:hypothetical protein
MMTLTCPHQNTITTSAGPNGIKYEKCKTYGPIHFKAKKDAKNLKALTMDRQSDSVRIWGWKRAVFARQGQGVCYACGQPMAPRFHRP